MSMHASRSSRRASPAGSACCCLKDFWDAGLGNYDAARRTRDPAANARGVRRRIRIGFRVRRRIVGDVRPECTKADAEARACSAIGTRSGLPAGDRHVVGVRTPRFG